MVVNKVDVPEVREALPVLLEKLKREAGHKRLLGISAACGERVQELMRRVRQLVESLPAQGELELFTEEDERVSFDSEVSSKFDVLFDDRFPGQYRVVGEKIERVSATFN